MWPWALPGWLEVPSELLNLLPLSDVILFSLLKLTDWLLDLFDLLQLAVINCVRSDLKKSSTDVWNRATKMNVGVTDESPAE